MKFWSSGELGPEAAAHYRTIINPIEDAINGRLAAAQLDPVWTGWTWAFLAIIISPTLKIEYTERVQRSYKNQTLEFRLKIDFGEFTSAHYVGQVELVFRQLHRTVGLMSKWKTSAIDQAILNQILNQVQAEP